MPVGQTQSSPLLSLLMVVRNGAAHIDAAIASARRQSLAELEIVVVDDGSTDATCAIVQRHAAEDRRVRLEPGPQQGLAAVRNRSLDLARAPWAAILDSDDMLHPRHAERLIGLATREDTPLAAANMIAFSVEHAELFASGKAWSHERTIEHETFVRAGRLAGPEVSLGYLKPLFRVDVFAAHGLRYDTRLRIGEDYDLVERALAKGLGYAYTPEPTYFYRRHSASTSFRIGCDDLRALIAAEDERPPAEPGTTLGKERALRRRSLNAALVHAQAVADIKAGRVVSAFTSLMRDPAAASVMARSACEGLARRLHKPAGDRAQSRWSVLLCGEPIPGTRMARAAELLLQQGCELRQIDAAAARPLAIAQAGRGVSLVLVADESQCEPAAYAIADGAPLVSDGAFTHAGIDHVLPDHAENLREFAKGSAAATMPADANREIAQ